MNALKYFYDQALESIDMNAPLYSAQSVQMSSIQHLWKLASGEYKLVARYYDVDGTMRVVEVDPEVGCLSNATIFLIPKDCNPLATYNLRKHLIAAMNAADSPLISRDIENQVIDLTISVMSVVGRIEGFKCTPGICQALFDVAYDYDRLYNRELWEEQNGI